MIFNSTQQQMVNDDTMAVRIINASACSLDGTIYLVNTAGIAECFKLKSGKSVWTERLAGTGGSGACWSSPVLAGDRLYVPNRNGDAFVLKAAPTFDLLAVNFTQPGS